MNIKDLIERLSRFPEDSKIVFIDKDAEDLGDLSSIVEQSGDIYGRGIFPIPDKVVVLQICQATPYTD